MHMMITSCRRQIVLGTWFHFSQEIHFYIMRMYVNGSVIHLLDVYIHISETICLEAMVRFSTVMVNVFRKKCTWEKQILGPKLDFGTWRIGSFPVCLCPSIACSASGDVYLTTFFACQGLKMTSMCSSVVHFL